jgi:broad specificity polyphosphatase/5'/3'-nucleotidase SurE
MMRWKNQFKQSDGSQQCGKTNVNNPTVTDDVERPIKTTRRLQTTWKDQFKQSEQNTTRNYSHNHFASS